MEKHLSQLLTEQNWFFIIPISGHKAAGNGTHKSGYLVAASLVKVAAGHEEDREKTSSLVEDEASAYRRLPLTTRAPPY